MPIPARSAVGTGLCVAATKADARNGKKGLVGEEHRYLDLNVRAHHVQLLASFCLEKVQEIGHRRQQDAATYPDCLCKLPLLHLWIRFLSRFGIQCMSPKEQSSFAMNENE